jgi:hypothetical protein
MKGEMKAGFDGDIDPVMDALRDLVERIESASYFDHGHLLELDPSFVEARDLVHGYAGSGPSSVTPRHSH